LFIIVRLRNSHFFASIKELMIKNKKPSKKLIVALVIIAALIIISSLFYWFRIRSSSQSGPNEGESPVNLEPPTKEDAQRVEDTKQGIIDRQKQEDGQLNSADTKQTVRPVITYASQYGSVVEVGAEVPVFEDGGTCTANFKLGSSTVTKSVQAVKNVNRVSCPAMTADVSEFNPKGSWTVIVSYSSASSSGTSNPSTVGVK